MVNDRVHLDYMLAIPSRIDISFRPTVFSVWLRLLKRYYTVERKTVVGGSYTRFYAYIYNIYVSASFGLEIL